MTDLEKQVRKTIFPVIVVFVIVAGMLAISIYYLYGALRAYANGNLQEAFFYTLLAATGVGISLYVVYAIRKRALSEKPLPKIVTTIECKKCGFKNLRRFEKGDYVFKSVENCQKCNESMLITAIYAEEEKKKK